MRKAAGFLLALCLLLLLIPFSLRSETVVIQNAKIFSSEDGSFFPGSILIRDGIIAKIGKRIRAPKDSFCIDAEEYFVLPGFIDAFTNIGTADVIGNESDYDEATSPVLPHLRILDALNPDNRFIPLARKCGTTAALSAPGEGNLLSGQSALIQLSGNSAEALILKFPVAVHANLGEPPKQRYGSRNVYPSTRMGQAALLRQTLIDVREYARKQENSKEDSSEKKAPKDIKLEALVPVLKGELPLIVRADRYDDIHTALRIAEEFNLKIILNQAAEAYRLAARLAAKNIPVLLGPVSNAYQREETLRSNPKNPVLLHEAGVRIAFQTGSISNFADLLYQAQTAVQNGLPPAEALKALTLYPAQIFGLDKRLGSIRRGKRADLVVFDKNPLDRGSKVLLVLINGRIQ
jgi:imidazolonepropionase-like amidohydrolase